MLYGYDAHVVKADSLVSNNGIGDHARSLLSAIATCRDAEKSASEDLEVASFAIEFTLIFHRWTVLSSSSPIALVASFVKM